MPDFISVCSRWWKLIAGITLLTGLAAWIVCLLLPKQYLSTATALPANSLVADKARIFNSNIEGLYPEIGLPDELDKVEGTATLDTLFIAASREFRLDTHYKMEPGGEALYKAALKLKKNSRISRSAYGELKIRVGDKDPPQGAARANHLLKRLKEMHLHLQNENTTAILRKLKEECLLKEQQYRQIGNTSQGSSSNTDLDNARKAVLLEQVKEYEKIMDQYDLYLKTNPPVLLTVEAARPALWADQPKTWQIIFLSLVAALACTVLMAVFLDSRKYQ